LTRDGRQFRDKAPTRGNSEEKTHVNQIVENSHSDWSRSVQHSGGGRHRLENEKSVNKRRKKKKKKKKQKKKKKIKGELKDT